MASFRAKLKLLDFIDATCIVALDTTIDIGKHEAPESTPVRYSGLFANMSWAMLLLHIHEYQRSGAKDRRPDTFQDGAITTQVGT